MAAKKSLMDTMQAFDKAAPVATLEPIREAEAAKPHSRPPSRCGKRAITGYFSQPAFTQFKILAAERNKDGQALVEEALNDLFQKYGKPPIA
jgi:hypothetical protein